MEITFGFVNSLVGEITMSDIGEFKLFKDVASCVLCW